MINNRPSKKPLILAHGINSDGDWQESASKLLSSFFDCRPYKHGHFRGIRILDIAIEWRVMALSILLIAFGIITPSLHASWLYWSIVVVLPCLGWVLSRRRFQIEVEKFCAFVGDGTNGMERPSMVAHSFGSYLSYMWVNRSPVRRVDRIIFCGSVLPSSIDWAKHQGQFVLVWNEVATRDRVARMAGTFYRLIPGLGGSGYSGFRENHVWVVSTNPFTSSFLIHVLPSRVINAFFPEYSHSGSLLELDHCAKVWLPVLLGISPKEYCEFVEACVVAYQADQEKRYEILTVAEEELWVIPPLVGDARSGAMLRVPASLLA